MTKRNLLADAYWQTCKSAVASRHRDELNQHSMNRTAICREQLHLNLPQLDLRVESDFAVCILQHIRQRGDLKLLDCMTELSRTQNSAAKSLQQVMFSLCFLCFASSTKQQMQIAKYYNNSVTVTGTCSSA